MSSNQTSRLYRLYTVKHGQIIRQTEFAAADDQAALAWLRGLRPGAERELWDVSCSPVRLVQQDSLQPTIHALAPAEFEQRSCP